MGIRALTFKFLWNSSNLLGLHPQSLQSLDFFHLALDESILVCDDGFELGLLLREACQVGVFSDGVVVFIVDDSHSPANLFVLAALGEKGWLFGGGGDGGRVEVHRVGDFCLDSECGKLRMHLEANDASLDVRDSKIK